MAAERIYRVELVAQLRHDSIGGYSTPTDSYGGGRQCPHAQQRSPVMQRAALYARVSTRRQEQEATIESQLDRC